MINIFSQPINDSPQLSGWNLVWQDEFDADTINYEEWGHDIGSGAPVFEAFGVSSHEFSPEGYPRDNFSVQWNGFIIPEYTTEYTFYIVADDGVRLWVNEKLIIDKTVKAIASITYFFSEKDAMVKDIVIAPEVNEMEELYELQLDTSPGKKIKEMEQSRDRVGYFICVSDSYEKDDAVKKFINKNIICVHSYS